MAMSAAERQRLHRVRIAEFKAKPKEERIRLRLAMGINEEGLPRRLKPPMTRKEINRRYQAKLKAANASMKSST